VVLTTCGSKQQAEQLAGGLVAERLAACVQALDITSHFLWKGALEREPEVLLVIKTRAACYDALEAWLREHHAYEVPEIVALPVARGLAAYLDWVDEATA
jgi:periplasmic divalent cation tolerance protein